MRTSLRRSKRKIVQSGTKKIAGQHYLTISQVATELGWSRDAILNWVAAPNRFTAGSILRPAYIGRTRLFRVIDVKKAKKALRLHGRLKRRQAA